MTKRLAENAQLFRVEAGGKVAGMNPPLAEQLRAALDASKEPDFKVVLIYENLAAGKRGECFHEKLIGEMDGDCNFNRNLWSFDVLAIPEIRNIAANEAAVANIVILSMSGKKKLPAKVKEWIEMWVWLIDRAHPVLVALFESPNGEGASVRAYLGNVAESKHIDFFPDTSFSLPQHH